MSDGATVGCVIAASNKRVIAVSEEGRRECIVIFEVATLRRRKVIPTEQIFSMSFSSDAKTLVTMSSEAVIVWGWVNPVLMKGKGEGYCNYEDTDRLQL